MSIFKIPISVCKVIEQRIANFWSTQNESRVGIHWKKIRGSQVGSPLLIQSPSSLWSRLVKGIYFPNGNFCAAGKGPRPSWGWQSLLMGRDTISQETRWAVGNWKSISICEDKWPPQGKIGGLANLGEPRKVEELLAQGGTWWDEQKLNSLFGEDIVKEILAIPTSTNPKEDKLIWTGSKTGLYTVKDAYNSMQPAQQQQNRNLPSSSYQVPKTLWRSIWNLPTQPKIKFFLWSLCQNSLPTCENLCRRKIMSKPL